jgi:hypothetical protein
MIFVKLAVLLWVAFLIVRFFVGANVTLEEKVAAAVGKKIKMTFGRWVTVIVFLLAIADSFAALAWFLFFR